MVFERPKRPGQANSTPATSRSNPIPQQSGAKSPKKVITVKAGGNGGNRGGSNNHGGNGDNGEPCPSPWLEHPLDIKPYPDASAGFVEYLRWMRSPDNAHKDPTKVQILQIAEDSANYRDRLTQLTNRTKLIAGEPNCFQVKSFWRIRVGGHRGPENILLPAFDALGIPYIPSSTLRGVARTQAIQHFIKTEGLNWAGAEAKVAPYFGDLKAKASDRSSKIIFLDAYPLPVPSGQAGGLAVDMANNIWNWDVATQGVNYAPNPNPFFSLKEPTFLIGIRRTSQCDEDTFNQVRLWLEQGLSKGIGSQVNTGYGRLIRAGQRDANGFFRINFSLKGQLIHGRQRFTSWTIDRNNKWQMRGQPDAEVRSVAFKSMLRYWFRVFALGVLRPDEVKALEGSLFGSITPQVRGWVVFRIVDGTVVQREARLNHQGKDEPCGEQAGTFMLDYSSEAPQEIKQKEAIATLLQTLTWMMFHLGGIGQGARRPCYSRKTRDHAPWWRGSTLTPDREDTFWELPDTSQEFQQLFQRRLQNFYNTLASLTRLNINSRSSMSVGQVRGDRWIEAADANCRIVVCEGESRNSKPFALAVLHDPSRKQNGEYDGNLCGKMGREVKPSPVWIADLGDYQVVTVFGATQNPRRKYLEDLEGAVQIFPFI